VEGDRAPESEAPEPGSPPDRIPLHLELVDRLGWLVRLRWIAVFGLAVVIVATRFILRIPVPIAILFAIAAAIALYNAAFWLAVRAAIRAASIRLQVAERLAVTQIILDLFALGLLIHFAGGVENPFIFYFIFHIIIASMLLGARAVRQIIVFAILLLSLIAYLEYAGIVPHWPLAGFASPDLHRNGTYVLAVVFVFGTTLLLAAYMMGGIGRRLLDRETQLVRTREDLAGESRRLEEALRLIREVEGRRSRFLRQSAHQLRSPLATIKTVVRSIADGHFGPVTERQRWLLSGMETRSTELLATIQDLLHLAHIREADTMREWKDVDLARLSRRILSEETARARERGIKLEVEIARGDLTIQGFEKWLRDLVACLVENAIRYSRSGGAVTYRLRREGDEVVGEVRDQGIGIPPEYVDQIFEEFVRAPNAKKMVPEGTGLGLSIVKSVIDAHRGRIDVASRLDEGSTFTFKLPCRHPAAASRRTEPDGAPRDVARG